MEPERLYEVRVRVNTLREASKIIQMLDSEGYKDVEMGPPRPAFPRIIAARMARAVRGRLNKMIMRALDRLGAADEKHGVEANKIVEEMKKDPEFGELVRCSPEGIFIRTVTMVSSKVLADRYGWVKYDPESTPRRFWLTERGIREAKSSAKTASSLA